MNNININSNKKSLLIDICNLYNEAEIADILINTLCNKYEIILSFPDNGIAEVFFKKRNLVNKYITESEFIILNGHLFDAFITLGSAPIMRPNHLRRNIIIDYFNSINVPTIDIQHGLFQYGINKVDKGVKIGNRFGECFGIPMTKSSMHQIRWDGNDGIGYIKSEFDKAYSAHNNSLAVKLRPYTLIITNYHSPTYSDINKINLLKSLSILFDGNKSTKFVWKPHPAEFKKRHELFSNFIERTENGLIPNLQIIMPDGISTPALIANCENVISTTSTSLLNIEYQRKKAVVFSCDNNIEIVKFFKKISVFKNRNELLVSFSKLNDTSNELYGVVDSGVSEFNEVKLLKIIDNILKDYKNSFDSIIAINSIKRLKYFESFICELASQQKTNTKKTQSSNNNIISNEVASILEQTYLITKLLNKMQKSTIAYKWKKALKMLLSWKKAFLINFNIF